MFHWILPLFLLLTATPSPTPAPPPTPLPLIGDDLTLTIDAEVFALMADEDDAFHLLTRPLPSILEPMRPRSLAFGGSEEEQRLIRERWRFWGLRAHDPSRSYPDDAWVLARHTGRYTLSDWRSLPQIPLMRSRFQCNLLLEQYVPQPVRLPDGAEGISAIYLCLTYSYAYGYGPDCGGVESSYTPTAWYALHAQTAEGDLLMAHVPLELGLSTAIGTVEYCSDAATGTTHAEFGVRGWGSEADWTFSQEGRPQLSEQGLAALITQAQMIVSQPESAPDSPLARVRAALDATFRTLARGEPLGVGDLKLLGGAGLQMAKQGGAVVVATGADLGAQVTVALGEGSAALVWLGGEGLLAQQ